MSAYDDVEYQLHTIRAALTGFIPLNYQMFSRIVGHARRQFKC